jgi:hypothetical protein
MQATLQLSEDAKFWGKEDYQILIPATTCDIELVLHSWKAAESVSYSRLNFKTAATTRTAVRQPTLHSRHSKVLRDFLTTNIVIDS